MKQKSMKSLITGLSLIILIGLIPWCSNAQKVTKLFEKAQYEKAEQYCAKQKGEKQKDCYKELADAYSKVENYEKAIKYYEKVFVDNKEKLNESYLKIANAYFDKSNYEKASEFYAKTDESKEGYLKIANTYFENKNYEKASEFYAKTDKSKEGYIKIADAYLKKGKYNKAEELYAEADKSKEGYIKIADAYFEKENYKKAIKYYEKAGQGKNEYQKVADAYYEKNDYENATCFYEKALNHYKEINEQNKLKECYLGLANTFANIAINLQDKSKNIMKEIEDAEKEWKDMQDYFFKDGKFQNLSEYDDYDYRATGNRALEKYKMKPVADKYVEKALENWIIALKYYREIKDKENIENIEKKLK
ncbi:MAG: tetratricopeptide repeat protein [Bacteroidales bacterium]|nr:tetratricopeptide repeat protein [Bacteroidales bacterium]